MSRVAALSLLCALGTGCDSTEGTEAVTATFTFQSDAEGWATGFADYSEGMEDAIGFVSEYRADPEDFAASDGALYLRGSNVSDDLMLYAKRRVEGLQPGAVYDVTGEVTVGSSAGEGCAGAGGAPGESVVLKVGAGPDEPRTVRSSTSGGADFVLNLDVGGQNLEGRGPDGLSVGDLAVPEASCLGDQFFPKALRVEPGTLQAQADGSGGLWLLVSTDSGFEGVNRWYFDGATFTLTPQRS